MKLQSGLQSGSHCFSQFPTAIELAINVSMNGWHQNSRLAFAPNRISTSSSGERSLLTELASIA